MRSDPDPRSSGRNPVDEQSSAGEGASLTATWLGLLLAYAALFLYARVGHHLQQLPVDLHEARELITHIREVLRI